MRENVVLLDDVPTTMMLAPGKGNPLSSLMVPVTVVCAKETTPKSKIKIFKIVFISYKFWFACYLINKGIKIIDKI